MKDTENKLVVTSGGGATRGRGRGNVRHKLLGVRQAQGCIAQLGE